MMHFATFDGSSVYSNDNPWRSTLTNFHLKLLGAYKFTEQLTSHERGK